MVNQQLRAYAQPVAPKCLELERAKANTPGIQIIDEARYLPTGVWPLCCHCTEHPFVQRGRNYSYGDLQSMYKKVRQFLRL